MTLSAYVAKALENRCDASIDPEHPDFRPPAAQQPAGTVPQRPRLNAQSQICPRVIDAAGSQAEAPTRVTARADMDSPGRCAGTARGGRS